MSTGRRRTAANRSSRPTVGRVVAGLLGGWVLMFVVVAGLGLLVTHVLSGIWPLSVEDGVNRWFAAQRTPAWNTGTEWMSNIGQTPVIISTAVLVAVLLRWWLRRWVEGVVVLAAVLGQSVVFLCTTLLIDRHRPAVPKLDVSPPTSSFPSGHTSATTALYLATAIVVYRNLRNRLGRVLLVLACAAMPLVVATARLYRGMHHPSDVAGAVVNGALAVTVALVVLRPRGGGPSRAP